MRLKKYIVYLTVFLCIVSLGSAMWCRRYNNELYADLSVGLFSSSFLALLVSIIEYANKRRETMEKLYESAFKALHFIDQYRVDLNLDVAIERVLSIYNYDYSALDTAFGALEFFFCNKKTKDYIFKSIYEPIVQLREDLEEPCYHLSLYKDGVSKNEKVAKEMIEKATALLTYTEEIQAECEDGTVLQCDYVRDRLYDTLEKELKGQYWDIMYLNPTRHAYVRKISEKHMWLERLEHKFQR